MDSTDKIVLIFIIIVIMLITGAFISFIAPIQKFNNEIKYLPENEVCKRVYWEYDYKDIPAKCIKYFTDK